MGRVLSYRMIDHHLCSRSADKRQRRLHNSFVQEVIALVGVGLSILTPRTRKKAMNRGV